VWSYCLLSLCVLSLCVWNYCMLSLCVLSLCVWNYCMLSLCVFCYGGRGRRRRNPGYRIKNKNPTQRCGEKHTEIITVNNCTFHVSNDFFGVTILKTTICDLWGLQLWLATCPLWNADVRCRLIHCLSIVSRFWHILKQKFPVCSRLWRPNSSNSLQISDRFYDPPFLIPGKWKAIQTKKIAGEGPWNAWKQGIQQYTAGGFQQENIPTPG